MMTAELRVRFPEAARTGDQLQVTGWIVEDKRRLVNAEASLRSTDGRECAHAWGTFLPGAKPGRDATGETYDNSES